jgi:pectin methylesterase-like acyl-CoA thioesterase
MGRKELRRIILGMILIPLLISTVMLTFNIQPVKAEPKTIIIPDDYPTIQAAVDAASPGDTIIVRAGTYTEKINVTKNHLIIRSESGAEVTNVQAFNLMSENVTINGFAITGGIRIYKFATWANNKIINNPFGK